MLENLANINMVSEWIDSRRARGKRIPPIPVSAFTHKPTNYSFNRRRIWVEKTSSVRKEPIA